MKITENERQRQRMMDLDDECARLERALKRSRSKYESALNDLLADERALAMACQRRMAYVALITIAEAE